MSTVTKVFIVLQLIFSIALGTMAIVLAGQTVNWKNLATDFQQKAYAANTLRIQTDAQWAAERAQLADQIARQLDELARRAERLGALAAELDAVKTGFSEQKVKNAELSAGLSQVSKSLDVELARAERLEARNNDLLITATDLRQRNLDLNERVKELTTNVTLLEQQVRALQQQRYALEQQLVGLQRALKRAGATVSAADVVVEPGTEPAGPLLPDVSVPIRGHIEQLDEDIAVITVGSDDGVSKGMVFVVYRDGNYLGRITVEEVDTNEAAGTVSHLKGEIKTGDRIIDESRLEAMN